MSLSPESNSPSIVAPPRWLPPGILAVNDWEKTPVIHSTDIHYIDPAVVVVGPESIDDPAAAVSLIIPPFLWLKSLSNTWQNPQVTDWRIATWLPEEPGSLSGIIKTEPDRYRNLSLFEAHTRLDTLGFVTATRSGADELNHWAQHCFQKNLFTVSVYVHTDINQPELPELKELGKDKAVAKAREWLKDASKIWGAQWITRTLRPALIDLIENYPNDMNLKVK